MPPDDASAEKIKVALNAAWAFAEEQVYFFSVIGNEEERKRWDELLDKITEPFHP